MADAFRDMCAELLADYDNCHYRSELSDRAHTLLDQPVAEGPTTVELMTDQQQHPITPPGVMVGQWLTEAADLKLLTPANLDYLAARAARWGWDQREPEIQKARDEELVACADAIYEHEGRPLRGGTAEWLRAALRPKPPTLKAQALDDLDRIQTHDQEGREIVNLSNIRLALESLPQ